VDEVDNMLIDN
jgi:hypothetical protein